MSTKTLKSRIAKSLDEMDETHLSYAYKILKQIAQHQKYANIKTDKQQLSAKLQEGIQQLDNGEGTDFRMFLNEMQATYGKKK